MLWLLLGLFVGLLFAVRIRTFFKNDGRRDFVSYLIPVSAAALGLVVGILFASLSPAICALFIPVKYQEVNSVDITAVTRTTSQRGEYVHYYIESVDESYKIDAQNATVVVSDKETPQIVTYKPKWKNNLWYLIAWK